MGRAMIAVYWIVHLLCIVLVVANAAAVVWGVAHGAWDVVFRSLLQGIVLTGGTFISRLWIEDER
jgi:hypothetical protein